VEQATTQLPGSSDSPRVAVTFFRVTSANRSVCAVSKTGTTRLGRLSSTLNRSIAASRRWNATGFRRVFWWFADVTAQTTVD
jgi:hypothetical protein